MPSTVKTALSLVFHTVHHQYSSLSSQSITSTTCLPHSPSPVFHSFNTIHHQHYMPSTQSITTSILSTQSITTSHSFHIVYHQHHILSTQSITTIPFLQHSPSPTSYSFHTVHHHITFLPHSPSPTSYSFHTVHHHITCLPHSPSPTSHSFHTVHHDHHMLCTQSITITAFLPQSPSLSPHSFHTQSITITTCLAHSPSQVAGAFKTIPPSKTVLCNLYHTMRVHATPGHPAGHCARGAQGPALKFNGHNLYYSVNRTETTAPCSGQ